ncbi:DUF6252 family protein [Flavobacteriaceae bacterium]|nr:DUF6252 family protein [Flavobacteriaceae bacterium]
MKKILSLLIILLSFFGCQDNIQSNSPAFQGLKNADFLWTSTTSTVVVDATGVLTFTGTDDFGTMTLQVPSAALGTFMLGADATALATYSEDDLLFSTVNSGNESVVYVSDGAIIIEEIDAVTGAITASYYFNAYTANGERVLNFSEGVIYRLPVTTITP